MIVMEIIGSEPRHISPTQGNHIRDFINQFDQPGHCSGGNAEKSHGSIRPEMRSQAQGPERSREDKNDLLQRVGAILAASNGRDPINGYVPTLFSVRKFPESGCHDSNLMPYPFQLICNLRAGIPRTPTNRWIFTINNQDAHTEKFKGSCFLGWRC